jgi:hypothetical protein
MSFIGGGGANIFIANGQTQGWVWTWNNGGWQGNTLIEPQPLNTGASLAYAEGSVSLNSNGSYSLSFSIANHGPNSTFYNIQTSSN